MTHKGPKLIALSGAVLLAVVGTLGLATANPPAVGDTKHQDNSAAKASVDASIEQANLAAAPPSTEQIDAGKKAFIEVAKVLQSPRCMNCHPVGDRPLQTDASHPHAYNISRESIEAGMACSTCHREQNSEAVGVVGGPPGAPHWGLPPKDMPMVFQGRTPTQLCIQLKTPSTNGNKTLQGLLEHVSHDPLVQWGWSPGGERTKPPLSHKDFVAQFKTWVDSGGACPE